MVDEAIQDLQRQNHTLAKTLQYREKTRMPYDLIADIENVTEEEINKRMARARTQLTQILTHEYEQEMYKHLMEGKPNNFEDMNKAKQRVITTLLKDNKPSIEEIIDAYQPDLEKIARKELKDEHRREDLIQKTWERVIRNYDNLDPEKSWRQFKSYVLTSLYNLIKNERRDNQRNPIKSQSHIVPDDRLDGARNEYDYLLTPETAEQPEGPGIVEDEELKQMIDEAIQTLPEHQRLPLQLREYQGMTYQEIADTTGTKIGTIKSRLNRARTKVQETLLQQKEIREKLEELGVNGFN